MPYALQQFYRPEWDAEPPKSWTSRLREISPVVEKLAHLRFRLWNPFPSWNYPERPIWSLYACTPAPWTSKDRIEVLETHWSEVPKEPEKPIPDAAQRARKLSVSDYQHFMWHQHRVDARPFWILQGEYGGTCAQYTTREKRILDAVGAISEPFPIGFFPPCPFDERAVRAVLRRDRLVQASNNLDELEKQDRPEALKAADHAAEKAHRETFLDHWWEMMQPQKEFMQSFLAKSENAAVLPPAPAGTSDAVAQWKDMFVEHGSVIGAGVATSRAVQVAVV